MRGVVTGVRRWGAWALLLALVAVARPARAQGGGFEGRGERTIATRLANGLEVVLSEAHQQPVFSMAVSYRVGGRHEPAELDELAHLVEHLSFRFSRHMGKRRFEVTDQAGVDSNGFTTDDETVYTNSGPIGGMERVLWLERQRMAFTLEAITGADVVTERRIIDNERSSHRADRVGGMFWHFVGAELYGFGHPYAPRQERGCVLRCDLRHVQWLMQRGYRPDNARLVVVGDFDAPATLSLVTRLFASIENPGVALPPARAVVAPPGRPRITIAAPISHARLHLYWDVPEVLRSKHWTLHALEAELTLLLKRDLVNGVGTATHVQVQLQERELGWLWAVGVDLLPGIDPRRVEQRVLAHVARLREQVVSIEAGRQSTIQSLLTAWDSPEGRSALLYQEALGFDLNATRQELMRVSGEDVRRVARLLLSPTPRLAVHVRRAIDAARRGELYREPE